MRKGEDERGKKRKRGKRGGVKGTRWNKREEKPRKE